MPAIKGTWLFWIQQLLTIYQGVLTQNLYLKKFMGYFYTIITYDEAWENLFPSYVAALLCIFIQHPAILKPLITSAVGEKIGNSNF